MNGSRNMIPRGYEPISAWGYVGYSLLFSIPIVGFIFLIIYSFSNDNINRRNFARSHFCILLIAVIIAVIVAILMVAGVVSMDALNRR